MPGDRGSPASPIPASGGELTPEWLTATLRAGGWLRQAAVVALHRERLGEGQGFVGDVLRLTLELDRSEEGAPRSLVAKLPTTASRRNRGFGQLSGVYEREIRFYRELAPEVGARTPRLYYGAFEATAGAERGQELARRFDRLPFWLLRPLLALSAWLSGLATRRSLLLLEDLAPCRVGDQLAGCSLVEAGLALESLARVHATFWNSPRLEPTWWLAPIDLVPRSTQHFFRRQREAFEAAHRPRVTPESRQLLDWLDTNGARLLQDLSGPPSTLLHSDYRLDNLFFDDARREVVVADWQSPARGRGAIDVAYFLSGTLGPETAPDAEAGLLDAYHAVLQAGGVVDYPREQLGHDYQLALLWVLQRLVLGASDLVELGPGRGAALMASWVERALARLRGVDPEALLPPVRGLPGGP